jgi:hypothetical protein
MNRFMGGIASTEQNGYPYYDRITLTEAQLEYTLLVLTPP